MDVEESLQWLWEVINYNSERVIDATEKQHFRTVQQVRMESIIIPPANLESGLPIHIEITIVNYYNWHLIGPPNWIVK